MILFISNSSSLRTASFTWRGNLRGTDTMLHDYLHGLPGQILKDGRIFYHRVDPPYIRGGVN